jgi:hypothetical protein
MTFRPRISKGEPLSRVSVAVSQRSDPKSDKRRVAIEFLLLEDYAGAEIVTRLGNMYRSTAHCRASVFRWISEVLRGKEEL